MPPSLKHELVERGAIFTTSTDTEVLVRLIARSEATSVDDRIRDALEQVDGAYSLVVQVGPAMYAIVDSRGFRPLVPGPAPQRGHRRRPRRRVRSTWWEPPWFSELKPGDFLKIQDGEVIELPVSRPDR